MEEQRQNNSEFSATNYSFFGTTQSTPSGSGGGISDEIGGADGDGSILTALEGGQKDDAEGISRVSYGRQDQGSNEEYDVMAELVGFVVAIKRWICFKE